MKKLSSSLTLFYKKIFPAIWFGFLFLISLGLSSEIFSDPDKIFIIIFPIIMALFGYIIMKNLVFDLVDEVYDAGEYLIVQNKGIQSNIYLKDIKNISYNILINPPRVTLSLRIETPFGKEVSFSPKSSFIPFKKTKEIIDLIDRVDNIRREKY